CSPPAASTPAAGAGTGRSLWCARSFTTPGSPRAGSTRTRASSAPSARPSSAPGAARCAWAAARSSPSASAPCSRSSSACWGAGSRSTTCRSPPSRPRCARRTVSLPSAAATPSRLVELALATLPAMRLEDGAFCHEVAPPGMQRRGRSLRYTLIVLIGLTRAERAGIRHGFDCGELAELVHDELAAPELRAGDLGLVLWADARLERPASEAVIRRLDELTAAQGGLRRLEGLELSWILIGAAEQLHVAGSERVHDLYEAALGEHLRRSATTGSGLLLHRSRGRRQDFPNFATEIYGVLALARAAQRGDAEALAAARRV